MDKNSLNLLDLKSEIINGFHPIEKLLKVMSKQSEGVQEDLTRSYAEIGLELCDSFRLKLDAAFKHYKQELEDDNR